MSQQSGWTATQHRIAAGAKVALGKLDPRGTAGYPGNKEKAAARIARLNDQLEELQELMFAERRQRLLIVLQGMDTSGKDGVVRQVFEGVNPQGVRVTSFRAPTILERERPYLWRVMPHVPAAGEIAIFNRSHYEDVLVLRAHGTMSPAVCRQRFAQINDFERMLAEEGTTILKFFLHISREEQRARLQERLDDPKKHWKFNVGDIAERRLWNEYRRAYEDLLTHTSSKHAPWYVVPADRNWYRNLVVAELLVATLRGFGMKYPPLPTDLHGLRFD